MAGGLNLYQFNGNNPVTFTDPFGLCAPFCTALIGAAVGSVGAAIGTVVYNVANDRSLTEDLGRNMLVGGAAGGAVGLGIGLLSGSGAATGLATAGAAAASKMPFEGFTKWGREAVGWGRGAAGAIRAMGDLTAERAASLDPAKVQAARQFYENAVSSGKGGSAAPARVELMQKILDLQQK